MTGQPNGLLSWSVLSMLACLACSLDATRKHKKGWGPGRNCSRWPGPDVLSETLLTAGALGTALTLTRQGEKGKVVSEEKCTRRADITPCGHSGEDLKWGREELPLCLPLCNSTPHWLPSASRTNYLIWSSVSLQVMIIVRIFPHCLISVLVDDGCTFLHPTQKSNTIFKFFVLMARYVLV